nr:putative ribonuclease H-like domain-containing protein [Tanacetum cinerariifolium]
NKAIEKGAGPNWLFDIDSLTKSMNYMQVDAGTNSTNFSGIKVAANQEVKKDVSSLRYIVLPNWAHDALLETSSSQPHDESSTKVPKGSGNPNPTVSSSNPPADQMETLTVESPISTVSSPVSTACLNDSPEPSSKARLISKRVTNQEETPSLDNILSLTNKFEDILGVTTSSDEAIRVEVDVSNMETTISASPTLTFRIHKDHPKSQIIGPVDTPIQTRHKSKEVEEQSFIATIYQKTYPTLLQFCLFSCFLSQVEPKKVSDALQDLSWNKKDERGIVVRNKARLVAQGHTQEEGIDYDELFAPVITIKAIRLFLAYASFMGFTVYQMDVKSAFLYGIIDEEVYVMQPPGFPDPAFPAKYIKWKKLCMDYIRLLEPGMDKYIGDILKKFRYSDVRSSNTPMDKDNPWGNDGTGKDVDLHLYRSMIGSLMYLTASRPDIIFAVCAYARQQVTPKELAYSDSDYGGASQDRKSTTRGNQFLGRRLSMSCEALSKEIPISILCLIHTAKTFDLVWIWLGVTMGMFLSMGFHGIQYISIQKMEDLKQQYLYELKRLSNLEFRDVVKIAELMENFNDQFEDFSESNEKFSSINDDSFSIDDIDYVEASPSDSELIGSEVIEIVIPKVGGIDDDILLTINHDDLHEKLLNVNLFIAKIEALNANSTLPSACKTKSSSTSLNSLLEETNTFDNSLPEFETFCFDVEEISSGSTTTYPDISLLEYEVFYDDHVKELSSGSPTTHSDSSLYASFMFDLSINPFAPADRSDSYEFTDELIPFISAPEELEEQQEKEDMKMNEQIARDAEVARIHAEEELQGEDLEIEKSTKEIFEEKIKEMMQLVPVEDVYVQSLQVKHPIIDWKVELKRLYEPDPEDQLWAQTQNYMHAPTKWKLYDLSRVHHVTANDKEIFMLVEKDYPLRKGLALVMISYKLHVKNYSQMAEDLIRKIYNIANTLRQQDD